MKKGLEVVGVVSLVTAFFVLLPPLIILSAIAELSRGEK